MALSQRLEPIMAITEMTELQAMNLEIFRLVQSDTAAAERRSPSSAATNLNTSCSKTATPGPRLKLALWLVLIKRSAPPRKRWTCSRLQPREVRHEQQMADLYW